MKLISPIRIVIIEDHLLFAQGLKAMLTETKEFEVCGTAQNIKDGLELIQETEFDILLLDVALPDGNGLHFLNVLKKIYPELKVVIISMFYDETYLKIAQRNGALGYFPKNIAIHLLVSQLKEIYVSNKPIFKSYLETIKISDCKLTNKEIEVLNFLKFGKNVTEIAQITQKSSSTIQTHKKNMLKKTNTHSVIEMIEKAKTLGWIK